MIHGPSNVKLQTHIEPNQYYMQRLTEISRIRIRKWATCISEHPCKASLQGQPSNGTSQTPVTPDKGRRSFQ